MAGISVGSVSVSVVPDMSGFTRDLRRQMLPQAERIGEEAGRRIAQGVNRQIRDIQIEVDTDGAMAEIARLNQSLARMDGRSFDVQINVDMGDAFAEVTELNRLLDRLDGRHVEVNVDVDRGVSGLARLTGGLGILGKALSPAKLLVPLASAGLAVGAVATTAVSAAVALAPAAAALFSVAQAAVAASPALLAFGVAGKFVTATLTQIFATGSPAVAALKPLADGFKEAGIAASRAAATGIRPLAESFARVAGPPVQAAMVKIGQATNRVMREFLAWGRSAKGVEAIKNIVGPIGTSMRALAPHVSRVAIAFTGMLGRIMGVSLAAGTSGLAGVLDRVSERLDKITGASVQGGLDKLKSTFETVRNVVRTLAGWIGTLVEAYKTYTTQFRLLADAVSIAAIAFGGPVVAIIGAVGLIIRHFDELKAGYEGLKKSFASPVAGGLIADLRSFADDVLPPIKRTFTQIKETVGPILDDIGHKVTTKLVPAFTGFVRAMGPIVAFFVRVFGPALAATIGNLLRILGGFVDIVTGIFQLLTAIITGDWKKAWDGVKNIVGGATGIVGAAVRQFVAYIGAVFRAGVGVITAVWGRLFDMVASAAKQGISNAAAAIRAGLALVAAPFAVLFNPIKTAVLFLWHGVFEPATNGIVAALQSLLVRVTPALTGVKGFLASIGAAALWLWRTVIVPVWNGISAAIGFAWGIIRPIFTTIATVIRAVLSIAFTVLLNNVKIVWIAIQVAIRVAWAIIRPIFNTIATVIKTVLGIAFVVFRNLVKAVWIAIQIQIKVAWGLIKVIFGAIKAFISNVLAPAFRWLLNAVIKPVWTGIRSAINVAWSGIKIVWNAIKSFLSATLGPAFRTFKTAVTTVWNALKSTISTVWNSGIKPVFNAIKSAVGTVKTAFNTAVNGIKTIWDRLKGIAKTPVNFIIGVYNRGIVDLVNKIADFALGKGKGTRLDRITPLARGGVLPGYSPGKDTMLAAVSPGESVFRPEFTRAVGPQWVHAANAVARTRGVGGVQQWMGGGFARGGIVGKAPQFAGEFFLGGIVGDFLKGVKDFTIGNIVKAGGSLLNKLFGLVPGSGVFRDVIAGIPNWIKTTLLTWLKVVAPKLGGDASGVVAAAKSMIGQGDDRGDNQNWITRKWGMPGAPWCFAAGTLIDTPLGLRPIEDLATGDEVITPSGQVIAVSTLFRREKPLLDLVALGVPDTSVTEDHPYWAMKRLTPGRGPRELADPEWIRAGDLRRGDMIALPIPADGTEEFDPDLAYVLGAYLADGHRLHRDRAVQFSDDRAERERIVTALKRAGYLDVRVQQNRTCLHFTVYDQVLYELCARYGDLAQNKQIPGEVFRWERPTREAFLAGYVAGDGSVGGRNGCQATTVSRALAHGLGKLIRSLGMVANVRVARQPATMTIEGREVETRRQYTVMWKPWPIVRPQHLERDGHLWVPVRRVNKTDRVECVYDLTVPGEHAFIADGAAVSNCAMFVSEAISKAKAQKKYPGHPSAAVASFVGAMKHVGLGDGRPGDLAAYRGSGHINVIEAKSGSGYMTIGGNQNALVQRGVRGGQSSILRPGFNLGGIVANQAAQIFRHEAPRNADKHEMQTPLVQLMRSLSPAAVRPVAQAIARNRLTVTDASAYDSGGFLPTGPSLVYNGTGRPEPVLTGAQFSALASSGRKVSVMEGATVIVSDPVDIDMLAQRQAFAARSASFG